ERVRQPDVYATVERPVVVSPGYVQVVEQPPIVMDRVRRIEAIPGSFEVQHLPPVYGSYTSTVMVAPARPVAEHIPEARTIVHQHVVVRPARIKWQRTVDAHGRVRLCKVEVPTVTRVVARSVMVAPATTIYRTIPAQYRQAVMPMLVRPART